MKIGDHKGFINIPYNDKVNYDKMHQLYHDLQFYEIVSRPIHWKPELYADIYIDSFNVFGISPLFDEFTGSMEDAPKYSVVTTDTGVGVTRG